MEQVLGMLLRLPAFNSLRCSDLIQELYLGACELLLGACAANW